jgi:phosphatidylcholine synthase
LKNKEKQMNNVQISDVNRKPTTKDLILAWSVHVFTATGAFWALLSILAIQDQQWRLAFLWMSLAMVVDGFDGTLARRFHTKELAKGVDGALLDNILDYITYVLVPVLFMIEAELLPAGWWVPVSALILISSAYQFTQVDAKTDDHYFKGFPSYWNVLIVYLFLLGWNPWLNLLIVLICVVLVFVPIMYIYPSRTERNQKRNLVLAFAWGLMVAAGLVLYPNVPMLLLYASLALAGFYVLDSLLGTIRKPAGHS